MTERGYGRAHWAPSSGQGASAAIGAERASHDGPGRNKERTAVSDVGGFVVVIAATGVKGKLAGVRQHLPEHLPEGGR
jgi:hypothetical protein